MRNQQPENIGAFLKRTIDEGILQEVKLQKTFHQALYLKAVADYAIREVDYQWERASKLHADHDTLLTESTAMLKDLESAQAAKASALADKDKYMSVCKGAKATIQPRENRGAFGHGQGLRNASCGLHKLRRPGPRLKF